MRVNCHLVSRLHGGVYDGPGGSAASFGCACSLAPVAGYVPSKAAEETEVSAEAPLPFLGSQLAVLCELRAQVGLRAAQGASSASQTASRRSGCAGLVVLGLVVAVGWGRVGSGLRIIVARVVTPVVRPRIRDRGLVLPFFLLLSVVCVNVLCKNAQPLQGGWLASRSGRYLVLDPGC